MSGPEKPMTNKDIIEGLTEKIEELFPKEFLQKNLDFQNHVNKILSDNANFLEVFKSEKELG